MTSARRISANRSNALSSTGPRSVRGKARASMNARRHGLSVSVLSDPECSREVDELANEIAGEGAAPEILSIARRVSEAQLDVVRVREARHDILQRNLSNPDYFSWEYYAPLVAMTKIVVRHLRQFGPTALCPPGIYMAMTDIMENKPQGSQKFAYILSDLTQKLGALDRYERRALSRRKFAIRELDTARRRGDRKS